MFIVIAQRAAFEFAVSIVGKNPKIGLLLPANTLTVARCIFVICGVTQ
jgi:hypothetical protein